MLIIVLKIIQGILWVLKFAITWIIKISVRFFALPVYAKFKSAKMKAEKLRAYAEEQFGKNLSRNTVLYGSLFLMSIFTATSNIKARELRPEEVGRNTVLYELLAGQGDFEVLIQEQGYLTDEETGTAKIINQERALSQIGVESKIKPTGGYEEEEETTLIASSGDAIVKPNIPYTDTNIKLRDGIITYVVQEGDTISQVAEKFDLSTNTILWENNIGVRDYIKPGQELVILPVTGTTHTIKSGDNLNKIASTYKSKAEDILEINKLSDASDLVVGTKIVIPDGIPPKAATPAKTYSSGLADLGSIFKPAKPIAGKLNWPTNSMKITQYYRGWRHSGLDIGVAKGNPLYAAESGVVTTAGWNSGGYGYYVIIDHGNGISTLYAHASKLYVKAGDKVKKGDPIAASGSTGRSTGPHLHFEVRVNGNRVNPLDYL